MRIRRFLGVTCAALFVASSAIFQNAALAGTASISIDSVGGRSVTNGLVSGTLKGKVLVTGQALPAAATGGQPAAKPLVADAGDSSFVGAGAPATLLGSGFGGTAPYTFAWTTSGGTLAGANAPTAQVDTTGLAAATYTATLSIADAAGTSATDTVKFVVYAPTNSTLLDQSKTDGTPGVLGVGAPGTVNFPFSVPAGTISLHVHVSWANSLNDYDLRLLDPSGADVKDSGNGTGVPEDADVVNPAAGTWTAAMDKFATINDTIHVTVTSVGAPPDPRPVVRSGGPYHFAIGATQAIAGSLTGGAAPVTVGWDTDQDGVRDRSGTSFIGAFGEGRQLITIRATSAAGLERRETTTVLVARPDRIAAETTAITVIAVDDTGINPYHLEFSAVTYPDPDVLALTNNFQKHPSQYIPGYPTDAQSINATLGQGYFPAADAHLWDLKSAVSPNGLEFGKLYWIPGTKIIGAIQAATFSCSNCEAGNHVILDDDGHGSGSTSVSTGNRYGYCPTCLLVISKGLGTALGATAAMSWVDINTNSWGTIANAPVDLASGSSAGVTRPAVERGQTILFAAGNGTANAFESPSPTYGTSTTGPDWNVIVGAIRRDNQRAIIGDGTPAHLSSWGDGNLPSACRTGTVSQCAFGGTSAATPYTAGIFGTVLTNIRRSIGDSGVGQRPGQVVADGFSIPGSSYLADGKLTRAELREAVFKTAFPLGQDAAQGVNMYPYPWTAPYVGDVNVLFEGYGAATPNSAKRATDVLLGRAPLPVRATEDAWFAIDRQIRDSIWGGYDRNGDGTTDSEALLGAFGVAAANFTTADLTFLALKHITDALGATATTTSTSGDPLVYWLHRSSEGEPGIAPSCGNPVTYMDQTDSTGDWDPCFENRATTVLASFRPVGIWPAATDSTVALPSGTRVDVELYLATDQVTLIRPTAVLMAGDRVLGTGAGTPGPTIGSGPWISQAFPVNPNLVNGAPAIPDGVAIDQNQCAQLGELCWNKFTWRFFTTRPAVPGEQLTFQIQLTGARAWSFGYEGQHRSRITITLAPLPVSGLDLSVRVDDPAENAQLPEGGFTVYGSATFPQLGTTEAGDHPSIKRVDVSVDDATFANPVQATLDESSGAWSAPISRLAVGAHTLYARASIDRNSSPVLARHITVLDTLTSPRVQWQVVPTGGTPDPVAWQPATGVLNYSFQIDTSKYAAGRYAIFARLLEQGAQTAITSVTAKLQGK